MYLRRNLFAILFVAVVTAPVVGQEADLQWKFTKDKKFYQEMRTETKQTMKIQGVEFTESSEQTFFFEWTPTSEIEDGIVTFEQKIIGVKISSERKISGTAARPELTEHKFKYDSKYQAAEGDPLNKAVNAFTKGKFTLTVDLKNRRIKELKGAREFVDELTKANPQSKPLVEKLLSEQSLKEMSMPMFNALPGKKVTKGTPDATWTYRSELDMGPIGKYSTTYTYRYDGPDKGLEKILVTSDLKYTPPDLAAVQNQAFRIKEGKLDAKGSAGTILYDPATGLIKSCEIGLTLSGNLVVEIGQQTKGVELTQTQKTTITTSATKPRGR